MNKSLALLARYYGIELHYIALDGSKCTTSEDTIKALTQAGGCPLNTAELENERTVNAMLRELNGGGADNNHPSEKVVLANQTHRIECCKGTAWKLSSIDDSAFTLEGKTNGALILPALESGVYTLHTRVGEESRQSTIIASPARSPMLQDKTDIGRCWGLTTQLYAMRSARNAGLGDFRDLGSLAELLAERGAAFLGTHPLHALGWESAQVISPYSPSHRAALNQHHIALDAIPGLEQSPAAAKIVQHVHRQSNTWRDDSIIDYSLQRAPHQSALRELFYLFLEEAGSAGRQSFQLFKKSANAGIRNFALYESISEQQGDNWQAWPAALMSGDLSRDGLFAQYEQQIDFHLWCQWLANQQLADASLRATNAGMSLGLYLDLAVGARRNGAESWCEQESIAQGVSVGAPPDHLSPAGQNWQLTAYAPKKLSQLYYAPFRQLLRSVMQHAGVMRIDHVIGLCRSFWIPDDGSPGAYINQPMEVLLALVRIEAARSGTIIIGEDLGLVPKGFRERIRESGFYGYSVWQYEKTDEQLFKSPDAIERQSLFCFATHDTPTIAGFEKALDIRWWKSLNWIDSDTSRKLQQERDQDVSNLKTLGYESGPSSHETSSLSATIQTGIAVSDAALVNVQMDDVLNLEEAQNLPGTIDEHPNWRRRYPVSLESLDSHPGFNQLAIDMERGGRSA